MFLLTPSAAPACALTGTATASLMCLRLEAPVLGAVADPLAVGMLAEGHS